MRVPPCSASRFSCAGQFFAVLLLLFLCVQTSLAAIVYVNINAPGPVYNGKSWITAFKSMADGMSSATDGDEVWVTKGTYQESVVVKTGASVFGGFLGNESARYERDWSQNKSIIDGSKETASAFGAVYIEGRSSFPTVFDGFTVQNRRNDSGAGGGVSCSVSSL